MADEISREKLRNNSLGTGTVYTRDLNLVITVPVDVLAPKGARPSAGTVHTEKF